MGGTASAQGSSEPARSGAINSTVSVLYTVTCSNAMTCARFTDRFPLSCSSFSIERQRTEYTGHGRIEIVDCGYHHGRSAPLMSRCGRADLNSCIA